MPTERRLRLFIVARILVTILFLASTIVLKVQDPVALEVANFKGIIQLMVTSCLFSFFSLIALRRLSWHLSLSRLQVVWDVFFVTLLLMLTDGIASPYSFLYILAIMSAGMLISRRDALYTAALCIILYGAMVDMQYYGLLQGIGLDPDAAYRKGETFVFYTIFLHLTGFVLAALVSGYLSERARITEVNYEELNRLHTTIVENLDSGLLTVNLQGGIRVFNPYLQRLTGISQVEAYNRTLESVFPQISTLDQPGATSWRGEFNLQQPDGRTGIIGYTGTLYSDTQGKPAGTIITLKDLTELKNMELALKRSDRLAALGEISARMAHEIRNPLTAISGSVQLLAEQGGLQEHETRLLNIVMRESDRLNGLITDFLAYARPRPPQKEKVNLNGIISDLLSLISADQRFSSTVFELSVPQGIELEVDKGQLQQVFLNLLQNAADAMPDGGPVKIDAKRVDSGNSSMVRIMISDQGTGMDEEAMQHIFEPFWTTKINGTGLGLATVYRIVEGHGGSIKVDRCHGGGTEIMFLLPLRNEGI